MATRPEARARRPSATRPGRATPGPTGDDTRRSGAIGAAVVIIAALVAFGAAFSTRTSLGDAPEYTAAVRTLGNVHTPGYPAYVLAARAFATVFFVGSWSTRVNLFSVVCAVTGVTLLYFLARRCGASVIGACIGSLVLTTCASFWFNAGFAKHYAFSSVLQLGAIFLAVSWTERPDRWRLVAAGALLGIGTGAGWQLALVTAIAILVFLAVSKPRLPVRLIVGSVAAIVVFAIGPWAFEVVRAQQHPPLNWGEPTTLSRLIRLVAQKDFHTKTAPKTGLVGASEWLSRTRSYLVVIGRDVGIAALIVSLVGAIAAKRRSRAVFALLMALLFVNLAGAVFGAWDIAYGDRGFEPVLLNGGYLIDVVLALALLVALGASALLAIPSSRGPRNRKRVSPPPSTTAAVAALLVVVLVVPSVVVHFRYVDHRGPALADRYGQRMLESLPADAVLVAWGTEWAAPMQYRQIVFGERRDVAVVSGPELSFGWYREQVSRRLGITIRAPSGPDMNDFVVQAVNQMRERRPVYLDALVMRELDGRIGYRLLGLVGAVDDTGTAESIADLDTVAAGVASSDREDGLGSTDDVKFPNDSVFWFHELAHIELAKRFALQGHLGAASTELARAADVWPYEAAALRQLSQLAATGDPSAASRIAAL